MSAETQATVFLVLVVNQLLAAVTFAGMYLRESGWRRTSVGRHLFYWVVSAAALDVSWLLLLIVRWRWLVLLLFASQAAVGLVGWHRVWLVWRSQRRT